MNGKIRSVVGTGLLWMVLLACGNAATPTAPLAPGSAPVPVTMPAPGIALPTAPGSVPSAMPAPPPVAAPVLSPDAVARAYLQAGSAADEPRIRELVDPACQQDAALMRVEAVRMMGLPMTIADLQLEVASLEGERASVRYTVRGSVHGSGGTTEVMGIRVQSAQVSMDGVTQSGTLRLTRVAGAWKIGCGG